MRVQVMEFRTSFLCQGPSEARMGRRRKQMMERGWKEERCWGRGAAGEIAQQQLLLLQRAWIKFSVLDDSQPPITPVSGHLMPSSGIHELLIWFT